MIDGNEVFKAEFSESSEEGSEGTYSIYIWPTLRIQSFILKAIGNHCQLGFGSFAFK